MNCLEQPVAELLQFKAYFVRRSVHVGRRPRSGAVRYLTAVQLGWAQRTGARDKVAAAYGVTPRQVQRWIATAGALPRREAQVREWASSVRLRSSTEQKAVRALERLLRAMAKRYRGD